MIGHSMIQCVGIVAGAYVAGCGFLLGLLYLAGKAREQQKEDRR